MNHRNFAVLRVLMLAILILPLSAASILQAQMKAEGPFCGKWINSGGSNGGVLGWTNLANARCDEDASNATSSMISGYKYTELLHVNNFNFKVPADAVIGGIEVVVIRRADKSNSLTDRRVSLTKGGVILKSNMKSPDLWEDIWTAVFYGGENQLWGEIWTPQEVNSVGFGVVLSAEFGNAEGHPEVDEILVTVHFSIPGESSEVIVKDRTASKYTCREIGG